MCSRGMQEAQARLEALLDAQLFLQRTRALVGNSGGLLRVAPGVALRLQEALQGSLDALGAGTASFLIPWLLLAFT